IGISSVTAVIAALTGLKQNVLTEFENLGTNKMFIFPYFEGRGYRGLTRLDFLQPQDFEGMLEHCPSVRAFTRQTGDEKIVSFADKTEQQVAVDGIEPSWHEVENRSV